MIIAIVDCNTTRCERSVYHPKDCRLPTCEKVRRSPRVQLSLILSLTQNFGEEIQQDVDSVADFCKVRAAAIQKMRDGLGAERVRCYWDRAPYVNEA